MLSVQSSLLCPQLLNRKHHMGMSMLPCISYCNLSINNIHSGEWETCSKGRSLAALCESSCRQEAIGRLIYREYHILHFKNLQKIFQSKTILRAVIGGPLQVTNARLNRLSALFLVAITTPVHSHTLF